MLYGRQSILSGMNKKHLRKDYFLLYVGIFIYSLCGLLSKLASQYPVLSGDFILYYGGSLLILALYALLWQQILKRFPLTTAYSNRPLATILGMLWGALVFHENITINQVVGATIIILGIRMAVKADER